MRRHRNTFQTKEQDRISEKELTKAKTSSLPGKVFKLIVIKTLTELERRMDELIENFNRDRKYKKNEPKLNNTITEMKNILEGLNIR